MMQTPLTVCPLSNVRLKCVSEMAKHNLLQLLHAGLMVTVNSDDPAYFGGYLNENFFALRDALNLSYADACQLVENGFRVATIGNTVKIRPYAYFFDTLRIPKRVSRALKRVCERFELSEDYWSSLLVVAEVPKEAPH